MARRVKHLGTMSGSGPVFIVGDLTRPADEALRQGHEWAKLRGAPVVIGFVHPKHGWSPLAPAGDDRRSEEAAQLRSLAVEALRRRVREVTGMADDAYRLVAGEGAPQAVIVGLAEEVGARLLVTGSHGHPSLRHIFLSDEAERIVHYAHCPVLVARPRGRCQRILVAVDFSQPSLAALAAAAEEARLVGARLTALHNIEQRMHVAEWMATFGSGYRFVDDFYQSARKEARRRIQAELDRLGVRGDVRVVEGDPAAAIVHEAGERSADLVVVGSTGSTGLRRALLGPVAERVVRSAPCSVLVTRVSDSAGG